MFNSELSGQLKSHKAFWACKGTISSGWTLPCPAWTQGTGSLASGNRLDVSTHVPRQLHNQAQEQGVKISLIYKTIDL